ncbi:MAG: hypothetical protein JW915_23535 [Chitinispirillaceae bacterium]|nr:hypothetical protein [Chitinispirillaceae bacterium]
MKPKSEKLLKLIYTILKISVILLSLIFFNCQNGNPNADSFAVWSFSGYVVDGYTQKPLSTVSIEYLNGDGIPTVTTSGDSGYFYISDLPFGERTFKFSYKDSGAISYTQKIIMASSFTESRSIDGLIGNTSRILELYPLSGSVNGVVNIKVFRSEKAVAAAGIPITLNYTDSSMKNISPVRFSVITDSLGHFSLSGLPQAPGAQLVLGNMIKNQYVYSIAPISLSQLFKQQETTLGTIYMTAADSTRPLLGQVISNMLSDDGFGVSGAKVSQVLWYILPVKLDSSTITVSLQGAGNPDIIKSFANDTIFIRPLKKFYYDSLVTVTISGLDSSRNLHEFLLDGLREFRTEKKIILPVQSNVLSKDGFGLTNVETDAQLWYILPVDTPYSDLSVIIKGGGNPETMIRNSGDTVYVTPVKKFKYDELITVQITGFDNTNTHFSFTLDSTKQFKTKMDPFNRPVVSNVLSAEGFGLTDVSVDSRLWYILPVDTPFSDLKAVISGGGNPDALIFNSGDTVFINPVKNFTFDEIVTVTISGLDNSRSFFSVSFDSSQSFHTEREPYPVASNTWISAESTRKTFSLNDTIWVKYSHLLDPDISKYNWLTSSATSTIYGYGSKINANCWVKADTLFIVPDQRLEIDYNQTIGFNISIVSAGNKQSDTIDFIAPVISDNYYIRWTNTKNELGKMRMDFGTFDSILVTSNAPIAAIKGISGVSGKTTPPDLSLDNITISGDTIIYKPALYLKPDSIYGITFDVLFKDGTMRYGIFEVNWKTSLKIQILSFDNRLGGDFRKFKAIGDSLTVAFSAPIDTSISAPIPFKTNLTDVNNRSIRTISKWSSTLRTVTIFNVDTLPSADYDASPSYTRDAPGTRAVKSISFDLCTQDGERVFNFTPKNENIEIHTEKGITVVQTNLLANHNERNPVERGEVPVDNFPSNGIVSITFNREIDTTLMITTDTLGYSSYISLKNDSSTIQSAISFSSDLKTIHLTPVLPLSTSINYYLVIKSIPGAGIAHARAINKNSGRFSGKGLSNVLLDIPFRAK